MFAASSRTVRTCPPRRPSCTAVIAIPRATSALSARALAALAARLAEPFWWVSPRPPPAPEAPCITAGDDTTRGYATTTKKEERATFFKINRN
jgi:hypothetical protein